MGANTAGNISYLAKFRSYRTREGQAFNPPIWQAARATLAHPNLFPPIKIGPELLQQDYISGEIGWSNPSNEVIKEFESQWEGQNIACLASVGTGHEGVIQIDPSLMPATVTTAMERITTNSERIEKEVAYRFRGHDTYFRLNVEHGLETKKEEKQITIEEIIAHTNAYLQSPGVTISVDALITSLLHATVVSSWSTTRDYFEKMMSNYIYDVKKALEDVQIDEVKAAAQEVVDTLEMIHVSTSFYISDSSVLSEA